MFKSLLATIVILESSFRKGFVKGLESPDKKIYPLLGICQRSENELF